MALETTFVFVSIQLPIPVGFLQGTTGLICKEKASINNKDIVAGILVTNTGDCAKQSLSRMPLNVVSEQKAILVYADGLS